MLAVKTAVSFRLQGVVTTYSPLTNNISFNSLQASRLDEREEQRNSQFSLGLFDEQQRASRMEESL